jgi:hypothetical protein
VSFARMKVPGVAAVLAACLACAPAAAQYQGQVANPDKNQAVLRAIAVLEWTGEQGKPKTSRLVPVCIFDGDQLQDAGIYLARPQPLAVTSDVEYELQENGRHIGLYDIQRAGRQQGYWMGFGAWKELPRPKAPAPVRMSRIDDVDDDKPVLHRKHRAGDKQGTSAPAADPDRPQLHRQPDSDSTAQNKSSVDDDDDVRPTIRRRGNAGESSSNPASSPAPDPDRPTLHKPKAAAQENPMVGNVEPAANPVDPNRPRLMRGKPTKLDSLEVPDLEGMPTELQQTVAVSDERTRPQHVWGFNWSNPDDRDKMKEQMEAIARDALGMTPPPAAPAPKSKRKAGHVKHAPPAEPMPLANEDFRVFELAYGTGATMVLTADSTDVAAGQKFVTLIAQPDLYGNVRMLFKSVTDTTHLDERPRMRLVDAVDVEADNRGELLFELRGKEQRQFTIYRIYRGRAEQIFTTGSAAGHFD